MVKHGIVPHGAVLMHAGNRLTALNAADRVPSDTALQPQGIHAQLHAFPQFQMPPLHSQLVKTKGFMGSGAWESCSGI